MKIHVVCCIIQGIKVKSKYKFYLLMTRYCVASLLKQGMQPGDITCIAENPKHCDVLRNEFGINTIRGPQIPESYQPLVSKKGGRKLFMYKPICLSECMPEPVDSKTTMVMTDVDALFIKNPMDVIFDTDVWSQHSFRYLRPSRVKKIQHTSPRLDDMKELTSYFGSHSQAYLFLKHKQTVLPEHRLTSNLVFIKPHVYQDLIALYKASCDDIIINKPEYCKGDQEILSSAVNILGLSYSRGSTLGDCSVQYNGGMKTQLVSDAKKSGVLL